MPVRVTPSRRLALESVAAARVAVRVGVLRSEWLQDGGRHPDPEAMGWLLAWGLVALDATVATGATGAQAVVVTDRGRESLATAPRAGERAVLQGAGERAELQDVRERALLYA